MRTTSNITHEFFKGCDFKFYHFPPRDRHGRKCERYCDACGKVVKGFVYHCNKAGWDLHPCCKNLRNRLDIGGIIFRLHQKVLSECMWCHRVDPRGIVSGIRGWSYVSNCKRYHCHVYCVRDKAPDFLQGRPRGNDNRLALLNLEQRIRNPSGIGGRDNKALKMALKIGRAIFNIIVSAILGNPAGVVSTLILELIQN